MSTALSPNFQSESAALSFRFCPDLPAEAIAILRTLVPPAAPSVLDVGCGIGTLARHLAPTLRVQAVDSAARMVEVGRAMPGGDHPALTWTVGRAEEAELQGPFGLIVAVSAFHLLDWAAALPRFAAALAPTGVLAVVYLHERGMPDLRAIGRAPFANPAYHNYGWLGTLRERGLFQRYGWKRTPWQPRRMSFLSYVESCHALRGYSREEMGWHESLDFDRRLFVFLDETFPDGYVETEVSVSVIWGRPQG